MLTRGPKEAQEACRGFLLTAHKVLQHVALLLQGCAGVGLAGALQADDHAHAPIDGFQRCLSRLSHLRSHTSVMAAYICLSRAVL